MICVDEPRWWHQGRRWAHLISDTGLDELHAFATALGLRRVGFQGDHYDVPDELHGRALAAGATLLDSREVVARLRAAGLRRRGRRRLPRWSELVALGPVEADRAARLAKNALGDHPVVAGVDHMTGSVAHLDRFVVLGRPGAAAALVQGAPAPPSRPDLVVVDHGDLVEVLAGTDV